MSSPKRGSLMDLPKRVDLTRLESTRSVDELERTFLAESRTGRLDKEAADQPTDRTARLPTDETSGRPGEQPSVPADSRTDDRISGEANGRTDTYTPVYTSVDTTNLVSSPASQPVAAKAARGREVPPDSLAARIRRERRGAVKIVGYKIPEDLKEELEAVARYNNSDMTRIVVEGIRLALAQLPHPPDWPHS